MHVVIRFLVLMLIFPAGSLLGQSESLNIVVFLADDLGWNDVGYHNKEVKTPNIDGIAAAGIELDRFYVNASCSPTRASLLTGQWATTHGVTFPVHKDMEGGLPLEHTLLSQYLKKAGYQTHLVGKWHLGIQKREYTPLARGFDSFYGFLGGGIGYYDHVFSGGLDWQRNGVSLEEEGYSTDLFAQEAVRVIDTRDPARPFFLYVSFNAPHVPIEPPGGSIQEHEGRASFLQMVESMDEAVGKVIDKLRTDSVLDNTLIIFASDNGGQISLPFLVTFMIPQLKDGYGDNSPLREGKGQIFDGGVRVPAAIWWPGRLESSSPSSQLIHVADLLPTLAEAVGFELDDTRIDGVSHLDALEENAQRSRLPFVVVGGESEALVAWPWKLVKEASVPFIPEFLKYIDYQLYQIEEDPGETNDVADQFPEQVSMLKEQLNAIPKHSVTSWERGEGEDGFGGEIVRPPWAEAVR